MRPNVRYLILLKITETAAHVKMRIVKRPTVKSEETMISRARTIYQLAEVIVQCWTITDIFVLVYVLSISADMNKFGFQRTQCRKRCFWQFNN